MSFAMSDGGIAGITAALDYLFVAVLFFGLLGGFPLLAVLEAIAGAISYTVRYPNTESADLWTIDVTFLMNLVIAWLMASALYLFVRQARRKCRRPDRPFAGCIRHCGVS